MFRLLVFAGFLIVAAYGDLLKGRIANNLVLFGLISALLLNTLVYGLSLPLGFFGVCLGVFAGAAPFMVFYLFGMALKKPLMGAGDVKLMGSIGAFSGLEGALMSIYYALVIAFFAALAVIIVQLVRRKPVPATLPFGSMLAAGALVAFVLHLPKFSNIVEMFRLSFNV